MNYKGIIYYPDGSTGRVIKDDAGVVIIEGSHSQSQCKLRPSISGVCLAKHRKQV